MSDTVNDTELVPAPPQTPLSQYYSHVSQLVDLAASVAKESQRQIDSISRLEREKSSIEASAKTFSSALLTIASISVNPDSSNVELLALLSRIRAIAKIALIQQEA